MMNILLVLAIAMLTFYAVESKFQQDNDLLKFIVKSSPIVNPLLDSTLLKRHSPDLPYCEVWLLIPFIFPTLLGFMPATHLLEG